MIRSLKVLGKRWLVTRLERQVTKLRSKNDFQVIAVAGSVGKTSTKLAIAQLLATQQPVCYQDGNYNDHLTVPLIFFDQTEPGLFNIPAWLKLLWRNQHMLKKDYPYKFVLVELGTDGPGQLARFAYLKPDIVVITAVAPEHMEYFGDLDAVAAEELTPAQFVKRVLLNVDDIDAFYAKDLQFTSYGLDNPADYRLTDLRVDRLKSTRAQLQLPNKPSLEISFPTIGKQGAKVVLAALAVADMFGYEASTLQEGLSAIKAVSGRLQILAGKQDSTIIDDTYNASPTAVKAALDVLYAADAEQRIAILGSMNELGAESAAIHQEIGAYCDPQKLDLVVTVGSEAQKYLAPAAQQAGCRIQSFASPYQAGEFVASQLKPKTVVLAKGSQNGVFAEEAVKLLLADRSDAARLVRQSPYWLQQKAKQFK